MGEFPSPTLTLYSKPMCLDFLTGIAYHIRRVSLYIYINWRQRQVLNMKAVKNMDQSELDMKFWGRFLECCKYIERMLIHTFLFWKRVHAVASATERHAGDERTLSRPFAGNTRWTPKIKPLLANTITRYTFIKLNFPVLWVGFCCPGTGWSLFLLHRLIVIPIEKKSSFSIGPVAFIVAFGRRRDKILSSEGCKSVLCNLHIPHLCLHT